jgi:hypothetical protein
MHLKQAPPLVVLDHQVSWNWLAEAPSVTDEAELSAGSLRHDLEGPIDAKISKPYLNCSLSRRT